LLYYLLSLIENVNASLLLIKNRRLPTKFFKISYIETFYNRTSTKKIQIIEIGSLVDHFDIFELINRYYFPKYDTPYPTGRGCISDLKILEEVDHPRNIDLQWKDLLPVWEKILQGYYLW